MAIERSFLLSVMLAALVVAALVEARHSLKKRQATQSCGTGTSCKPIESCPLMLSLLRAGTPEGTRRVREAICSTSGGTLSVCCNTDEGNPDGESLLPKDCKGSVSSRIIEGEEVPIGSLPFMALLGFTRRNGEEVYWACGGALINDRYVLTAAHCLHRNYNGGVVLSRVVIGEHNYTSSPDCQKLRNGQRFCADKEQVFSSFPADSIIIHENFAKRNALSDDIALIRLDRPVKTSKYASPICLPPANQDAGAYLAGRDASAAGWGLTTSPSAGNAQLSSVLRGVKLPYVDRATCTPHIKAYTLIEGQICFGGAGQRDTCDGDSGGPIIGSTPTGPPFHLLGVVSGGASIGKCGTPGIPAVYTDVAYYRNWIASKLRP